jgi:threonine dehydratase
MELRKQGYEYIETSDDGDTWVGSQTHGLEISDLIQHGFLGDVKMC